MTCSTVAHEHIVQCHSEHNRLNDVVISGCTTPMLRSFGRPQEPLYFRYVKRTVMVRSE